MPSWLDADGDEQLSHRKPNGFDAWGVEIYASDVYVMDVELVNGKIVEADTDTIREAIEARNH